MTPKHLNWKAVVSPLIALVAFGLWVHDLPGLPVALAALTLAALGLWDDLRTPAPRPGSGCAALTLVAVPLGMGFFLVVVPFAYRQVAADAAHVNLKHLALAMYAYHDRHKELPPHAVVSPAGDPLLSWRVALLPYLEQADLHQLFRLDRPWDQAPNHALLPRMPSMYWPVTKAEHPPDTTFYQGFVGPGAAFDGPTGKRLRDDFPDGRANTILLVEAGEAVVWTKPADLPFAPGQPLPKLGGALPGQFYAAMADGSVRVFAATADEAVVRALIIRNGGEAVSPDAARPAD